MKKIGLYLLAACAIMACQKEDGITPRIGHENLYTIEDDPGDSIQHKRYELYKTYGVPVYFNDTIGRVFVKTDINGDSIFRYETLDLNWIFNGTNRGSVTYQVTRLTDPDLKMKALRFAEVFLENSQPALYPYAMWLTEKCYELSSSGATKTEIVSRYRNLMFSWIESIKEEEMQSKAANFRNQVIKLKVQNYDEQLNSFNKITDERYYDVQWSTLYPDEIIPYWQRISSWYPIALFEEWRPDEKYPYRADMLKYGNSTNENFPIGIWTDEDVDNYIIYSRGLVGAYGFVYSNNSGSNYRFTPKNTNMDLEIYLEEMMNHPRQEFLERWEGSPLVLKKYEILYAIIRDELGVEL